MKPIQNLGTGDVTGDLRCDSCGYVGDVMSFLPTMSVYTDICCPNCGSTNNAHNGEYLRLLQANWRKSEATE